jgi:two-component system, chemotaxis family, protein-glutamate methylesterase/glutaminase
MIGLPAIKAPDEPFTLPVIGMAASAGGLTALSAVLAGLPAAVNAAILVVQHVSPTHPSHLAKILGARTRLQVREAANEDRLCQGVVLTAPPGAHLVVDRMGLVSFTHGPVVNWVRPSADSLFESLARSFGPRAIAVVLTGTGRDGASGAQAVKRAGGILIVQDEATSEFFGMPGAAIHAGEVDRILSLDAIAPALEALTRDLH